MATIRAHINPELLVWARERARFDEESIAARLGTSAEQYATWEAGTKKPTLKQLRRIAKAFGRPPAMFYLDSPPDEPEVLKEMRHLPSVAEGPESPDLALQVRLAVERREVAFALHRELHESPPYLGLTLSLSDDPEEVAPSVRDVLGVSLDEQVEWSARRAALRNWRLAFERAGVLVFQVPGVPLEEMRGFAIAERPLPVIAYNSKDTSDAGRIFTLFHEFGHVLLGSTSLDTQSSLSSEARWQVERFCNHLAAATLVPKDDLVQIAGSVRGGLWAERDVMELARRFGVSGSMMVRRLNRFDLIASGAYEALLEHFDTYVSSATDDDGGGNVYSNRLVHIGRYLTELAFRTYSEERMTATDLSALVNLQVRHLDALADTMMMGGSVTQR